jgi:hypothetical protein
MPLTLHHHYRADQLRQRQAASKAKQIFLNALAVQAAADYLTCMGVLVDLDNSEGLNPLVQVLSDSAGLLLPGQGTLECRPVLPDAEACWIPPETWSDRLGYLAVQVNADLTEAQLIGFLPSVESEQVELSQFQSIEGVLDVLEPSAGLASTRQSIEQTITQLGQWLQGMVSSGWQTMDELLTGSDLQPALSFRAADAPEAWMTRGKIITLPTSPVPSQYYSLAVDTPEAQVALFVGVLPNTETEVEVWVRVCPLAPSSYLPHDMLIQVLDRNGESVMQAQSRQTDMIQLRFQASHNESFCLQLSLDDWSITEAFVI